VLRKRNGIFKTRHLRRFFAEGFNLRECCQFLGYDQQRVFLALLLKDVIDVADPVPSVKTTFDFVL